MFFKPEDRDKTLLPHDPLKAIVAPRPIGWISSLSLDGVANLAPYSFFNMVGGNPPLLMFSSEGIKDTARNAIETGEFVFNYASENLTREINESSIDAPAGVSEFNRLGIKTAKSNTVSPPRVASAFAALECKVTDTIEAQDIMGVKTGAIIIIGQVTGVHIDEHVIKDGRFDTALARPLTRLGYMDFGLSSGFHELQRPKWNENE